ncbi:hypothetical protein RI129_010649 [Pyrocoelia pectoralis]|uniref:Uncharacterized protein n=1 Tax=Pyrocoelia pectoralis TaxID=417401 RepID=A0AAN7V3Q6_9COLE
MASASARCEHYKRFCKILAPCCSNVYSCHICHDEKENHPLDRYKIKQLICNKCNNIQDATSDRCNMCRVIFGQYACLYCFIFDDNPKGQFHCFGCGLCRVGGEENYFHCKKCEMCYALRLMNNHKCVEKCVAGDCSVCTESLNTSCRQLYLPPCGHILHENCYEQLRSNDFTQCIVCKAHF